jgi:hypothetical protein
MEGFAADWKDLGLADDDLMALQVLIMLKPKGCPVVRGTGGLRKMRFSPPKWGRGKSGAIRVCYVFFEEYRMVLLIVAYAKNEADDLSAQQKKDIRKLIARERAELSKRAIT